LIEKLWHDKRAIEFHYAKNEELDRSLRTYLMRTKPTFEQARTWVLSELPDLLRGRIRSRLDMSAEEYEHFKAVGARCNPHFATYWSGSFIVDERVSKGRKGAAGRAADPAGWWSVNDDVTMRGSWLRAYAAERLDLLEVVQVRTQDCERCGGTGTIRQASLKQDALGRHETLAVCPRCFGARQDRSVAYR
jgi:hypothetical protein